MVSQLSKYNRSATVRLLQRMYCDAMMARINGGIAMASEEQEQKPKLLSLRLPLEMYNQVSELAEKERRSIHSQLLVLIEDALRLAAPKQPS